MYKWLWTRIGSRPWTYITRDARQKYPLPWQLCLSAIMLTIGHYCWNWTLLWVCIGVVIGIFLGHFWWGSKYIPNQKPFDEWINDELGG